MGLNLIKSNLRIECNAVEGHPNQFFCRGKRGEKGVTSEIKVQSNPDGTMRLLSQKGNVDIINELQEHIKETVVINVDKKIGKQIEF